MSELPRSGRPQGDAPGKKNISPAGIAGAVLLAVLWWAAYSRVQGVSSWLVFNALGLERESHVALALEFFLYDTAKILLLLVALIYVISWLRAGLNAERVRDVLTGRKRGLGYALGALFGAVTPFCSCSSVPLFLGFTTAGIPTGITMAFLITSPVINEIAVVLLWGLLGVKFTLLYVAVGLAAGIMGGAFMDAVRAERFLQPFVIEAMKSPIRPLSFAGGRARLTLRDRHDFARRETSTIFRRVWKWVIAGVGVGAALHGFVPAGWFAENLGAGDWWTVPAAVFLGIPLYSNVTGIVPVMESLLSKGMSVGTTMAFCMSAVAASLPELILLRQVMTAKMLALFLGYVWVIFTLTGWLFNALQGVLF